eukprot:m51a1_g2638 hypothetical protein (262) ;mRNA; r:587283-588788
MQGSSAVPAGHRTKIWQAKQLSVWAKEVLVSLCVEPGVSSVCDLYCGSGAEIGKIERIRPVLYTAVDPSEPALSECKSRWAARAPKVPSSFFASDPCLQNGQWPDGKYDAVCCFDGLQRAFESQDRARCFMRRVASLLKPGGRFFGVVMDSSALWMQSVKKGEGALFKLQFPGEFMHYGSRFHFIVDEKEHTTETLVHFPTLLRVARDEGLVDADVWNMQDFYSEFKHSYSDFLSKSIKGKVLPEQMAVFSLYAAFVFVRE